jgi:NADH-quinone oxidoreductase subunit L
VTFQPDPSTIANAAHQGAGAAAEALHAAGAHAAEALHIVHPHSWGYLFLIPLFPLLGAAINAFLGLRLQRRYGKRVNHTIAIAAMALSCLVAEIAFWGVLFGKPPEERFIRDQLWTMWQSGALRVNLSFALDPLGMVMTLIVTHVATLIHIYSVGYMADEPAYWRFFMWLNLFVFSMLLLVMGSNFVVMFFGWEGVGLCSYGLIGFWYQDVAKASAAMKAFVVNRFGDFGFIIGLFILFWSLSGVWSNDRFVPERGLSGPVLGTLAEHQRMSPAGVTLGPTLEFTDLRNEVTDETSGIAKRLQGLTLWGVPVIALVCIFMFVGAAGKSAQIPLYVWLPDAMAGPTPVSALIHAATMVTAGVYMIARLNFLYALSPLAMTVVATVGALTALFAASIGFFQYDIKKVLAYSTVSQLGFMFIGVGVGAYWAGIFHLMTHAFFKACLFLASGSVILACHHEQDMRKMGGLARYTPRTRWTYLIACWAIAGFPIASGFYSKDEILWKAWTAGGLVTPWIGHAIYLVGAVAALGTAFYMFRSYYMTFTGEYRGGGGHEDKERMEDPHAMAAHAHAAAAIRAPSHAAAAADVAAAGAAHQHDHGHGHGAVPEDAAALRAGEHAAEVSAASAAFAGHAAAAHGHSAGQADAHGHDVASHGDAHGHGGMPHESPDSMTVVLMILAGAALVAGFIFGLPSAWTGHEPLLEQWLAPSLPAAEWVPFHEEPHATELLFQLFGVAIATAGWLSAKMLYDQNLSPVPARLKERFAVVWAVVYNKYYVDELYQATVVRFSLFLSRALYWFDQNVIDALVMFVGFLGRAIAYVDAAIDTWIVDGAVNGVARLSMAAGRSLRRVQTGHIQTYLFGALAGAIAFVIIQYVIR